MDDAAETLTLRLVGGLNEIDREAWDGVANPPGHEYNPFVSWDFLEALEASGCATMATGWGPRHLIAEDAAGDLIGAVPAYLKTNSQGEYVFDHGWAEAYDRAGGRYYPKLLAAVPFTPVTGPRLLTADPALKPHLAAGIAEAARQLGVSSAHVTFPTKVEWDAAGELGLLLRQDSQFIWRNRGYTTFDDFLADLASRKRKNLKKERAAAQDGLEIVHVSGDDLRSEHWDAFFDFYVDTGARKWGHPYLNRAFFDLLHDRLRERVILVLARADGDWVAGALNMLGSEALFGRYWGCVAPRPFLHFELCYYQAVDIALERGLSRVEAGAQGGHKLARGYAAEPVYSFHWIADPGFRDAVADYLDREREAVGAEIEGLRELAPFKKSGG